MVRPSVIIALLVVLVILAIAAAIAIKHPPKSKFTSVKGTPSYSADQADRLMVATMLSAITNAEVAGVHYPLMLVTNGGEVYKLKSTVNTEELSFNYLDGLGELWNWGKGICHLVPWAAGLVNNIENNASYDWSSNVNAQGKYAAAALADLPNMLDAIDALRNQMPTNPKYTTTAPIVISATRAELEKAATDVLRGIQGFCHMLLNNVRPPTTEAVDVLINRTAPASAWLMYAVNEVGVSRAVRALIKWKIALRGKWKDLTVVVNAGATDSPLATPRGACTSGNISVKILQNVVSHETANHRTILYRNPAGLTWDRVAATVNRASIAMKVADAIDEKGSLYSNMLAKDLRSSQNALAAQFADRAAENTAVACNTAPSLGTYCPLNADLSHTTPHPPTKGSDSSTA
jgi:hypothetical protein